MTIVNGIPFDELYTMEVYQLRETGEFSDLSVSVNETELKLHKFPMISKSGYFRQLPQDQDVVTIDNFPGGVTTFNMVADFCYNIDIKITKENVLLLRCAAEVLKMTSPTNLIEITDKYINDMMTSAKLSRSINTVVDLLTQACSLGDVAEKAGVTNTCIEAMVDTLVRTTIYSPSISRFGITRRENECLEKVEKLPFEIFLLVLKKARDQDVSSTLLAKLVQRYIAKLLHIEDEKAEPSDKDSGHEEEEVDASIEVQTNDTSTAQEDFIKIEQLNESDTESNNTGAVNEQSTNNDSKESKAKDTVEPNVNHLVESILSEVPENTPFSDVVSTDWAARVLNVAGSFDGKCRDMLIKLASQTLHKFKSDDLIKLEPTLMIEVMESAKNNLNLPPAVVCRVVDDYLLGIAQAGAFSVEVFVTVAKLVPDEDRVNCDILYDAMETLLKTDQISITDEERTALHKMVDFSKVNEKTLQKAFVTKVVPCEYVTKAAIDLCAKLREELANAKSLIKIQDRELREISMGSYTLDASLGINDISIKDKDVYDIERRTPDHTPISPYSSSKSSYSSRHSPRVSPSASTFQIAHGYAEPRLLAGFDSADPYRSTSGISSTAYSYLYGHKKYPRY
ncbi:unnamed protein product [Owenia fusiformis]|uniref:Uncharacterized protein n=1 Tax=Owenia fusiformis TaxID=6347 RepID=A0A8J1T5F9_OWEFU|nr:unnamed protein product [Owenia fusiformis]